MTVRAYNIITQEWTSTEDGSELTPSENWIINPIFDDEAWAMEIGPNYWTINGNNITTISKDEYQQIMLNINRQKKWKEIQEWRDWRIQNGGYKVGNYWFHSDNSSRIQQLGLVMMGNTMPRGIMWKTMSGEFVEMTPELALQIFRAASASDMLNHSIAEIHKRQMMASNNPCEYDWINQPPAWPPIFGE